MLEKKYGSAAKRHIFATTDVSRASCAPWPTPRAGRPMSPATWAAVTASSPPWACCPCLAGIDVAAIVDHAIETFGALYRRSPDNPVWQYAAARQHLYGRGYGIELLASYEPSFRFMGEWWKQLYGESEGKNGIGIFPRLPRVHRGPPLHGPVRPGRPAQAL